MRTSLKYSLLLLSIILCALLLFVYAGKDYYSILGVPRNAAADQIRRAYKKLTMKYHPDRNKGDKEAEAKFLEVSKAYDVLNDEKQRAIYDKYGEEGIQQHQQRGGGGAGAGAGAFGGIFEEFFGGGAGGFQFNFGGDMFGGDMGGGDSEEEFKGEDLKLPLEVTLEDLYAGKLLSFRRVRGAHSDNAVPKACECRNKVIRMEYVNGVMRRVVDNNCPECQNRFDVMQKTSDLTIQIDQGMKDGETITFYGEGDATTSHRSGDLIFVVRALPHSTFQRFENDLRMRLDISLKEALVGFTRVIKRLDGSNVEIKMDTIIRQGEVRQFRGEGMPLRQDPTKKGDLYIEFNLLFPTLLSEEQKAGLAKLL